MTAWGVVIFFVFFFLGFVAVVVTVLAVDALVVASRRGGIAAGCSVRLEDRGLRGFSIRGEGDSSISRRIGTGFCATSSVPLAYTTWGGQKDTRAACRGRVYTRTSLGEVVLRTKGGACQRRREAASADRGDEPAVRSN